MKNAGIMPCINVLFLIAMTIVFWFFLYDDVHDLSDIVHHLPTENARSSAEHRIGQIELSAWVLLISSLLAWISHLQREIQKIYRHVREDSSDQS
jgi:hypothetical protein